MDRLDVFRMVPPSRPEVTGTFGDLTISVRGLDVVDEMRAEQEYLRLVDSYCGETPAMSLPAVGGQVIVVCERLCEVVSRLWAMQCSSDSTYSSEELIALAVVLPAEWREMAAWAAQIDQEAFAKKAGEGGESMSCTPPSGAEPGTPDLGSSC